MNIFVLDTNPCTAAQMHCDKHVVKMIVEYAQLLSTAHRVCDGTQTHVWIGDKPKKFMQLPGETPDKRLCYNLTHANHPAAIWARHNSANYHWLVQLLSECLTEYTARYNRMHATSVYLPFFRHEPMNLRASMVRTQFPQTMPPEYQVPNDPVLAYQAFYLGSKIRFARWTNRRVPEWFATAIIKKGHDVSQFQRAR